MAVLNRLRSTFPLSGVVRAGKLTKELLRRCSANEVLVISHRDLDESAATQLMDVRPAAIINTEPSISGAYPVKGALQLLQAGIPLLETSANDFEKFLEGEEAIIESQAIRSGGYVIPCSVVTLERCSRVYERAVGQMDKLLLGFIANTLTYAEIEIAEVVRAHECPPLNVTIANRPVVVVSRENGALNDLLVIAEFIRERKPVLIGVDGGADILRKAGFSPDLIVGDMDSVSDAALRGGAELVVHAYGNGNAPGLDRLVRLGLYAQAMRTPGTSEDMALLLAYGAEAELIVTVGMHTHMVEYLEKGRCGMGSTLLVRMLLGGRLVDAKGLSKLFKPKRREAICELPFP